MEIGQTIFVVAVIIIVVCVALREIGHRWLSDDGYEYATLCLVITMTALTIAAVDGIKSAWLL